MVDMVISMIRSEREYVVTKSWVKKLEGAVAGMDTRPGQHGQDTGGGAAGLQSHADEMKRGIAEYDTLKAGSMPLSTSATSKSYSTC